MAAAGCKYCACCEFKEETEEDRGCESLFRQCVEQTLDREGEKKFDIIEDIVGLFKEFR
jgi:quinol monooxygenase YgiN